MPFPRWLASFNRTATNRVTGLVAGTLPGFAILHHVGRRSGATYRTPVNAFRDGNILSIALTYGRESDWVRNVMAAGGCEAEIGGERTALVGPRIVHDEKRARVPALARLVLRVLRVADFLECTVVEPAD